MDSRVWYCRVGICIIEKGFFFLFLLFALSSLFSVGYGPEQVRSSCKKKEIAFPTGSSFWYAHWEQTHGWQRMDDRTTLEDLGTQEHSEEWQYRSQACEIVL